jgi:hypothetical protein
MQGWEFQRMDLASARLECERRARLAWNWMQREQGFAKFRLVRFFPMMGVREGPRLVGRHVLTENEIQLGWQSQPGPERFITLADHELDIHGAGGMQKKLKQPYGVPYECLLPREYRNVAAACRGAGFSHIAASSCRLSRTMMQLGHAAGLAAAVATQHGSSLPDVRLARVRQWLEEDDVALTPEDPRFPRAAMEVATAHP